MLGKAMLATIAVERNQSEEKQLLAGMLQHQTDSQTGFAVVALEMSIFHLFSLRINWRVYYMTNPTISENIIMHLCHCIFSHNCYHSIGVIRINLSKICYTLGLEACSDVHHFSLIARSSTDRKTVVDVAGNNQSCSNNLLNYSYHLNFDIANFSVCDDQHYFGTDLHSCLAIKIDCVDCRFDYHHGHY